jgi:hypothetical protein
MGGMAVTVVVGAQFGDEGKGKMVDWLAQNSEFKFVLRCPSSPGVFIQGLTNRKRYSNHTIGIRQRRDHNIQTNIP